MPDPRVLKIASTKFRRQRSDGTTAVWHQEDESSVKTKPEAVGMVQRTIDFWLPKLIDDLAITKGITRIEAIPLARSAMQQSIAGMMQQPFAKQWELSSDDFNLDMTD